MPKKLPRDSKKSLKPRRRPRRRPKKEHRKKPPMVMPLRAQRRRKTYLHLQGTELFSKNIPGLRLCMKLTLTFGCLRDSLRRIW